MLVKAGAETKRLSERQASVSFSSISSSSCHTSGESFSRAVVTFQVFWYPTKSVEHGGTKPIQLNICHIHYYITYSISIFTPEWQIDHKLALSGTSGAECHGAFYKYQPMNEQTNNVQNKVCMWNIGNDFRFEYMLNVLFAWWCVWDSFEYIRRTSANRI